MKRLLLSTLCLLLCFVSLGHSAVVCDGVDDTLTTGVAFSNFITSSTGTITLWIRPTGSAPGESGGAYWSGQTILDDDGAANEGFFRATSSGVDHLVATTTGVTLDTTFTNTTWIHLGFTLSGGVFSYYKDGTLVTSSSGASATVGNPLSVCKNASGGVSFNGQIGRIDTYSVAISANELATLGKSRMLTPGLMRIPTAVWLFDECADGASLNGVGLVDRSGNGRTLTANDGANNTGMTCKASDYLSYQWSVQ